MRFQFLAAIMALVKKLGPQLEEAWPILLHIYADIVKLLEIINVGPLPMALQKGAKSGDVEVKTKKGKELVKLLTDGDVDSTKAKKLAVALESLDQSL